MSIYGITREELQKVIFQLEQAFYNHVQWYYSYPHEALLEHPGFIA